MKFTTTLLAASAAALALTTGTEARLGGSHGRQLSIYGGSRTAYSVGGTNYNRYGYKSDPSRSAMDDARRAGALTNDEARRMGYSSNYRDEDDNLGWQRPTWGGLATWIGKDIFFKPFADGSCGPNNRC